MAEGGEMLVAIVEDDLVEALAVLAQPGARRRGGGVVDDRQPVGPARSLLDRVNHRDEVVETVVAEQDDVDRLGHALTG